jgi:hypothetical protein
LVASGGEFGAEETVSDICGSTGPLSNDLNGNGIPDECEEPRLDIKPGSCPNAFNPGSHGVLPVAVVGASAFDVSSIDLSSISLSRADGIGGSVTPHEGPPGPHSEYEDVATPFFGEPCDCHTYGGDGITDLSMKFMSDDVVAALELGDVPAGTEIELVIDGLLLDGTPFTVSDCMLVAMRFDWFQVPKSSQPPSGPMQGAGSVPRP